MVCIDCSGIHRSIGVDYSKIRSLNLDNIDKELVEILESLGGTSKINKLIEHSAKSNEKPKRTSSLYERENYIINKYKLKKYLKPISYKNKQDVIDTIFKNIEIISFIHKIHVFI